MVKFIHILIIGVLFYFFILPQISSWFVHTPDTKEESEGGLTPEQQGAINAKANSQDASITLREEVSSDELKKSGCSAPMLPATLSFDVTVMGWRPTVFSKMKVGYPDVDRNTININQQSIWSFMTLPFGKKGYCHVMLRRDLSLNSPIIYQRTFDVKAYLISEDYSTHLSYKVPDNDCDGFLDDHISYFDICCYENDYHDENVDITDNAEHCNGGQVIVSGGVIV